MITPLGMWRTEILHALLYSTQTSLIVMVALGNSWSWSSPNNHQRTAFTRSQQQKLKPGSINAYHTYVSVCELVYNTMFHVAETYESENLDH